jgi:hypothetical protein
LKKSEFLTNDSVQNFMHWLEKKMDRTNSFNHDYNMKKPIMHWECNSIFSAYENYCWSFRYNDPINGRVVNGKTFDESALALTRLSQGLRKSLQDSEPEACRKYCCSILQWGGVLANNDKRVNGLGMEICYYLKEIQNSMTDDRSSEAYYQREMIMNSGFTKIYSLYIDGFIIYDGRVGAALGLLVRLFCEEYSLAKVPDELLFAWGKGKESSYQRSAVNRRNPGSDKYTFPELSNNPKRHTENNIRANWLLKEIAERTDSKFNQFDGALKMRAIEAALFMIGYQVNG